MSVANNIEESLIIINRNILKMFKLREYIVDNDIQHDILLQNTDRFIYTYMFDSPARNMVTFVYTYKLADILNITMQKKEIIQCYETFLSDKSKHQEETQVHRTYTLMLIVGGTNTKKMNHIKKNVRLIKKEYNVQFEVFTKAFFALHPPDHYLNPEFTIYRQVSDVDRFLKTYHMANRIFTMMYTTYVIYILYDGKLGDYFLVKRPN